MGDTTCFSWSDCKQCLSSSGRDCAWYLANNGTYACVNRGSSSGSPFAAHRYSSYYDKEDCPDELVYTVVLQQLDRLVQGSSPNWSWIISICITVAVAIVSFYIGIRFERQKKKPNGQESIPMAS